jgi:hypothetical protein
VTDLKSLLADRWDPSRQANYPWPWSVLIVMPIAGALGWLLTPTGPLGVVALFVGLLVLAWVGARAQWALWSRRHPQLPTEEWVQIEYERTLREREEAAPWNWPAR